MVAIIFVQNAMSFPKSAGEEGVGNYWHWGLLCMQHCHAMDTSKKDNVYASG